MSKLWRIALAWMLASALPMQGYAAHAMLNCGPAHAGFSQAQSQVQSQLHSHAQDLHQTHDHAAHGHHEASSSPVDAHNEKAAAGGDGAQIKPLKTTGAGKCSACSSCCSAAAITVSVLRVEVIPQQVPFVATIPAGQDRVLIGGLERPPRASLA